MRTKSLFHSLSFKTTLVVTGALAIILSVFSALRYEQHRELELSSAQAQAAFASSLIEASLEHEMLTQDLSDLASIVNRIGQQPGIRSIYLLDLNDQVQFSPQTNLVGTRLDRRDPACQVCHVASEPPRGNSILFTSTAGEQLLRYCEPIANRPECYGCHNSQQRILGALISDLSLTETNQRLNADLQGTGIAGVGAIVIAILVVHLLLSRFALGKLQRFAPIVQRFGQGDLAARLPPSGDDEVGLVATAFNQMANGLQTRERENERLHHELQEKETARSQLLQKVIATQEEERRRISRELHDDFAQSLTALSVTVQSALQTLPPEMRTLRQQLEQLQALVVDTLGETSRWIQDLRPRMLDDLGLAPSIRMYAELRLEASGTAVEVEASGLKQRLPPEIEITLFRVVQEAVANIAKHAHARHARIR
ncbi:MAG: HAMP domain-containing protein, partial [Chloroflexota bacterium]|nr:HAMP domain-containing protein [Chloroflexota bacterium]